MTITREQLKNIQPKTIAVIGPTNEGKTSVLRTLSGNADFGDVNALTGTTVRAEIQKFFYQGVEILHLIDTPGFQMSSDILEILERRDEAANRSPDRVTAADIFEAIPKSDDDYRHDLRAWKELVRCDEVILVVNVMESPRQSLMRDTLRLLVLAHKPVLVVFNNVREPETVSPGNDFSSEWYNALAANGFHLVQVYDAHRRNFAHEIELFQKLLLFTRDPIMKNVLQMEIDERILRETRRIGESKRELAKMLLDMAMFEESRGNVPDNRAGEIERELVGTLHKRLFERERATQLALLKIWEFPPEILRRDTLDVATMAKWTADIFGDAMMDDALSGGKVGAGVGAAIGLTLDIALAGLSLGTGATIGALLGGMLGAGGKCYHRLNYDKTEKRITVAPQRETLQAVMSRGVDLVKKLQCRGKAIEDTERLFLSLNAKKADLPAMTAFLDRLCRPRAVKWLERVKMIGRVPQNTNDELLESLVREFDALLPAPKF